MLLLQGSSRNEVFRRTPTKFPSHWRRGMSLPFYIQQLFPGAPRRVGASTLTRGLTCEIDEGRQQIVCGPGIIRVLALFLASLPSGAGSICYFQDYKHDHDETSLGSTRCSLPFRVERDSIVRRSTASFATSAQESCWWCWWIAQDGSSQGLSRRPHRFSQRDNCGTSSNVAALLCSSNNGNSYSGTNGRSD